VRYRCRVGHAWSQTGLGGEQDESVEAALFIAWRALEDKAALQRRIAENAGRRGVAHVVARARKSADDAVRSAGVLRRLLAGTADPDADGNEDEAR
jgi:two-component system chemotaxis response regulator CheB